MSSDKQQNSGGDRGRVFGQVTNGSSPSYSATIESKLNDGAGLANTILNEKSAIPLKLSSKSTT